GEIVDAALTLFVERGFAATRLDEVAREAGISKGTLYLYFKNKEDLFRAVVQELVLPELDKAEKMIDSHDGSAEALLRQLVKEWWRNVGESRLSGIPKLIISEAGNFPELARFFVDAVVLRGRHLFVRVIEKGIATKEFRRCDVFYTARALTAPLVFSVIWKHSLAGYDKESYDANKFIDAHLEMFINGLRMTSGK
ncbi:MAG: TetR/AcrR family transcriptional regulator, partial [Gammaproteobacteria bacterium]|nr:TetR/AcrR family transcriptional regulator [Gammaproteobacteria bacterium]